jgi:hypothetical protein
MSRNSREKRNRRTKQKGKKRNRGGNGRSGSGSAAGNGAGHPDGPEDAFQQVFGRGRSLRDLESSWELINLYYMMSAMDEEGAKSPADLIDFLEDPASMVKHYQDVIWDRYKDDTAGLHRMLVDTDTPVEDVEAVIEKNLEGRVPVIIQDDRIYPIRYQYMVVADLERRVDFSGISKEQRADLEMHRANPIYKVTEMLIESSRDNKMVTKDLRFICSVDLEIAREIYEWVILAGHKCLIAMDAVCLDRMVPSARKHLAERSIFFPGAMLEFESFYPARI